MSFMTCSGCGHQWNERDAVLRDPLIKLIGYQVNFDRLNAGLFMFNHTQDSCMTTLSVPAGRFEDLYHGEIFHERLTGSEQCPGYCLHASSLQSCPAKCECRFVRDVMQVVANWPKEVAA